MTYCSKGFMGTLHIVQGGIDNGDKDFLVKASRKSLNAKTWVVPKSASPGDDVVVYIMGFGFFATATISSEPRLRRDWANRYGAALTSIELIEPAISLGTIRRKIPNLKWANYPRSITTPNFEISSRIRKIINDRKRSGVPDLYAKSLLASSIDELRKVALLKAKTSVSVKQQAVIYRARSLAIKLYVLKRANGTCEGCCQPAPFLKPDNSPYLEPHHTLRLADEGPDHPMNVIALCPNCHRRAHHAGDARKFNQQLIKTLSIIEKQNE